MLNLALLLLLFFQQAGELELSVDPNTGRQRCDENVCTASGDVILKYQDLQVNADSLTWNRQTGDVAAEGNLRFTRGEEKIEGDRIELNIRTRAGRIVNAKGYIGPGFYVSAAEAIRYADGRYELHDADVTSCAETDPDWTLRFKRAFLVPGKSVTAAGSVFRLQGIPLFYFPYIAVPAQNRDRSTGFLMPGTGTSNTKGRSFREAFFWAIDRSVDATITGEYFTKRGPAAGINFRAVLNPASYAEINAFFVRDKQGQGGRSARIFNYTDLGHGYRAVADMNLVSSFVFRQVFEDGLGLISSPIEHRLAYLTRNQPKYSYNILYSQTGIFFPDQPNVVTRKFPSFEAGASQRQILNLPAYFTIQSGLSAISRKDTAFKTRRFVGRMDVQPVLELPVVRTPAFEWSHRIAVRETYYSQSRPQSGRQGAMNRFLLDYSTRFTGPQLERDFGTWRHVVEPSVEYRFVTGADRFKRTIVVDDVDLLSNNNAVEYAVTNRFLTSREIFSWRIGQEYYFDPTFGDAIRPGARNTFGALLNLTGFGFADGRRRFSPIVSNMRLSTSPSTSTDLQIDYDSERHRFESAGISGGVNRGQAFGNVAYFFRRNSPIQFASNQLRANFGYGNQVKPGLSLALSAAYDVQRRLFQESITQVGYNWDCYGVSLEWTQFHLGARRESQYRFQFSLKNIGTWGNIRPQDRIF